MSARGVRAITRLEKLLDKVNSPPRAIKLIPKYLIGGACGCAETAVNAFAKNAARFLAKLGFRKLRG